MSGNDKACLDHLPESDQSPAFELVKKLVLAWDPDYTKLSPAEKRELDEAFASMERGEYVSADQIDWD